MKYIDLINNYWKLRQQGLITAAEGDLYLYLLHVCNGLHWQNPFNQPSLVVCSTLHISRATLATRRRRLQEVGLLEFEEGTTNTKPPIYIILGVGKVNNMVPKTNSAAVIAPGVDEKAEDIVGNEEPTHIERIHEVHPGKSEFKADCLKNTTHLDTIAMHLKMTRTQVDSLLDKFLLERELDGRTYTSMSDLRGHFSNYCRKKGTTQTAQVTTVKVNLNKK